MSSGQEPMAGRRSFKADAKCRIFPISSLLAPVRRGSYTKIRQPRSLTYYSEPVGQSSFDCYGLILTSTDRPGRRANERRKFNLVDQRNSLQYLLIKQLHW